MEIPEDDFCPIIFGRPFLNTTSANIDCKMEVASLKFEEEVREFHFSSFKNHPQPREHDNNEEKNCIIGWDLLWDPRGRIGKKFN
jgi:hypothetical protein